jgi:ADP-heptose:LPS heptosyltransferase
MGLIDKINKHNPDYKFVIIGASFDTDLADQLIKLVERFGIHYSRVIGQSLGYVIEAMKRLKYFFSFPSGLGILAPTVSCPIAMFYPPSLSNLINTWADPNDIKTGLYKGCLFCEPEQILNWCIKNKKI